MNEDYERKEYKNIKILGDVYVLLKHIQQQEEAEQEFKKKVSFSTIISDLIEKNYEIKDV